MRSPIFTGALFCSTAMKVLTCSFQNCPPERLPTRRSFEPASSHVSRLHKDLFFFFLKQIINALSYVLCSLATSSSHLARPLYSALGLNKGMFIKPDTHAALGRPAISLKNFIEN